MKEIVPFVEGEGDEGAAQALLSKLLQERSIYDVFVGPAFRAGDASKLAKNNFEKWQRLLGAARKRPNCEAVILLLDGDVKLQGMPSFCAANAAKIFAEKAREVGAGRILSVAVIFACKEFESWLIAGVESLAGKKLPDGRAGIKQGVAPPDGDLENEPRNAKGWLRENSQCGYKEPVDQAIFTRMLDWDLVRKRPMRSFARLEHALKEVVVAIQTGKHISTPTG